MLYKGYEVEQKDNKVYVKNIRDFDLTDIFESGQCFRWKKQTDGSFTGVAMDRVINIRSDGDLLILDNTNIDEFINIWFNYFDLGTDYAMIKETLSKNSIMKEAIASGGGIRLLRQDLWEAIISFIISANNNIPRIMKIIDTIAACFGRRMEYKGDSYYTFPKMEVLSSIPLEQIKKCGTGYRCKYITEASRMIIKEEVNLCTLGLMDTEDAKNELQKLPGVGPKVADCILLFSGTKFDVFPIDVWVKRVMEELYFSKETSMNEIKDFAKSQFGLLAGYAQQYLFYYARSRQIGVRKG